MALNSSGAYVSVWRIMEPKSDACISVLYSNSAKKKATGTYKEEFNGFITFIGEANRKIRSYPYEPSTDPIGITVDYGKRNIIRPYLLMMMIFAVKRKGKLINDD